MKFKTTAKAIRANGGKIVAIGYCAAQYLLRYEREIAYTAGTYGWNFDVYDVDGITVCTGYRGMPGKHIDYAMLNDYESRAEKIVCNYKMPYEEQKSKFRRFCGKCLKPHDCISLNRQTAALDGLHGYNPEN